MSPNRPPNPVYIAESISGSISANGTLYIGLPPPTPETIVGSGEYVIRYAIPLIVPSTQALLFGLFLSERGQSLTGREAWDYLQSRFQLHPRADVIGMDLTGKQQQLFVKALDFGVPVRVLAYADLAASLPVAELNALHTDDSTFDTLPDLLQRYLRRS